MLRCAYRNTKGNMILSILWFLCLKTVASNHISPIDGNKAGWLLKCSSSSYLLTGFTVCVSSNVRALELPALNTVPAHKFKSLFMLDDVLALWTVPLWQWSPFNYRLIWMTMWSLFIFYARLSASWAERLHLLIFCLLLIPSDQLWAFSKSVLDKYLKY